MYIKRVNEIPARAGKGSVGPAWAVLKVTAAT